MLSLTRIIKNSKEFEDISLRISRNEEFDVHGLTPTFKPYFLSALSSFPNRGLLWITPSWDSCEKLYEASWPFIPEELRHRFQVFPEFRAAGDQDLTPSLRMKTLKLLADGRPVFIVAPFKSLLEQCEKPDELMRDSIEFIPGVENALDVVIDMLEDMGYSRNFQVERRGEYAVRGGILDVYPSTMEPVRVEYFGDEVDSIRTFNLDTQISTGKLESFRIFPKREYERKEKLLDFLPENWLVVVDEPSVVKFHAVERNFDEDRDLWNDFKYELRKRNPINVASWGSDEENGKGISFNTRPLDSMGGNIEQLLKEISDWQAGGEVIAVSTQHLQRFKKMLHEKNIGGIKLKTDSNLKPGQILLLPGDFQGGFYWLDQKFRLVTDKDILGASPRRKRVLRTWDRTKAINLNELKQGDKVVHLSHGIGRFKGLAHLEIGGTVKDFVELEYHKEDKLFVPVQQLDLLQKYVGPEGRNPNLSKLGKSDWQKTRKKAKESAEKIAAELLKLYSEREKTPGFVYSPDSMWQLELESSFPFEETPDQETAIVKVKEDMESGRSMDRLLCGDAGYGKTEVALRAAFKATQDDKQVALLTPTTILAAQHYENFRQRLAPFPVEVSMLSRFRSKKEQKETAAKLGTKEVDIVIGTHRILSKDIKFKDLGLIIVDEEQHFGVKHKEKLKKLKVNVDVLTLTATPIPRTLHMALSGIRELSIISTPPEDRLPVKTHLHEYDKELIRSAIIRELNRGGQVYFLTNRVRGIEKYAQEIRNLVPFAKVAVGHGQMDEHELELVMLDFYEGNFDVLVCTTIIESGLDVPNANTIIINNAQNFGLAQLYQLRGRVGRSSHQAYAYLLYPPHMSLTEDAEKRLEVIKEFSHLGAGYQIAMKDLEIRGAGDILGSEQSGYIAAVGFDLYCQLLKEAVDDQRGVQSRHKSEPPLIDLPVDSYIPVDYITDSGVKLEMYRKIALIDRLEEIDKLVDEFRDRFGELPEPLLNLFSILRIKLLAWDVGAPYIKEVKGKVQILLPGVQSISLKRLQKLYEKTKVASSFHRSVLTLDNLLGRPSKLIAADVEKEDPRVWIPKLEKVISLLLVWKEKKLI